MHQAYEKLSRANQDWESRSHFFAAASKAMWQVLVDHARHRAAPRNGGDRRRLTVEIAELAHAGERPATDVLALHDVLERLATYDPLQAELVHLRFFADLTMTEIATTLGITKWKAEQEWRHARAWLLSQLGPADSRSHS